MDTSTLRASAEWTIDDQLDVERASDGISRFGAYLTTHIYELELLAGDSVAEWLWWCWHTATGPVMSPGYVTLPDAVTATTVYRDSWLGEVVADVEILAGLPAPLSTRWASWQRSIEGSVEYPPEGHRHQALTSVRLTAPLLEPPAGWPAPVDLGLILEVDGNGTRHISDIGQLVQRAKATVAALAASLHLTFVDAVAALAESL